jgi:hypothetical protein
MRYRYRNRISSGNLVPLSEQRKQTAFLYLEESIYTNEWERPESNICVSYLHINHPLYSVYLILVRADSIKEGLHLRVIRELQSKCREISLEKKNCATQKVTNSFN